MAVVFVNVYLPQCLSYFYHIYISALLACYLWFAEHLKLIGELVSVIKVYFVF